MIWSKEFEVVSKQIFIFNIYVTTQCSASYMNFKFFLFLSFTLPSLLTTERWKWIFLLWKFLSWEWIFPFTWKIYCFKIPLWRVVFLKIQQSLLFVLFVSFHENSESSVDDFSSLYFASSLRCHLSPVSPWQTWLILMLLQLLEICVLKMQIAFCKDFLFFFDVHSISTLLQ